MKVISGFKSKLVVFVTSSVLAFSSINAFAATEIIEDTVGYEAPDGTSMALDAFIAKPIQAAMVAGGFATWFVSLPFTYGTDTEEAAWQRLVRQPADNLQRCLGCTEAQDDNYLRYGYKYEEQE